MHANHACRTWAYKLTGRLAGHENVTYFDNNWNCRKIGKSVISREFITFNQ